MALEGKHALITGSSRGIGRGIAVALAENGVKVAVHYFENDGARRHGPLRRVRRLPAAKETLEQIRKRGSDGFIVRGDVTRSDEISKIFHTVKAEFGSSSRNPNRIM